MPAQMPLSLRGLLRTSVIAELKRDLAARHERRWRQALPVTFRRPVQHLSHGAPRAAISRSRAAPRASSKFATFAQTITSLGATRARIMQQPVTGVDGEVLPLHVMPSATIVTTFDIM